MSKETVVLLLGRDMGEGVLRAGHTFSYGKFLGIDYEDEDSQNVIIRVSTLKGERSLHLSKSGLVLASCEPTEHQHVLSKMDNMITSLLLFISRMTSFGCLVKTWMTRKVEHNHM